MASEIVQYQADNGQDITVTEQDVRDLMAANGNATGNITSQEIKTFMRLCQAQRLNPFTKDAYLVKYGSGPATIIASKETFTKRAQRNSKFRGFEAGITVIEADGKLCQRAGSMLLRGESLAGGWCRVYVDGYEAPMYDEVSFAEYNTGKSNWLKIPATMIRKVAICHALREAFPEDLGGLYGAEEMDQASAPYEAPREAVVEAVEPAPQAAPASPLDAYRAALTAAKRERGIPVPEAMEEVSRQLGKPPEKFCEADVAAAVSIVQRMAWPLEDAEDEPYEVELVAEDIEF